MNAFVTRDPYTGLQLNEDSEVVTATINSLLRNNTFVPNVRKLRSTKTKDGRDKLIVSFADGTWTEVVRSKTDEYDMPTAFLYALAKRIFGKPTTGGFVEGNGFMTRIKNIVGSVKSDEDLAREKEERIRAKEEADRLEHEKAMERRRSNPTMGYRLRNLEDKLERLADILGAGLGCDGGEGGHSGCRCNKDRVSTKDKIRSLFGGGR